MRSGKIRPRQALVSPDSSELIALLDWLPHGLCVLDPHGHLRFCNRHFLELLKIERVPLGEPVAELLRRDLAAADRNDGSVLDLFSLMASRAPASLRYRLSDGRTLDINHTPLVAGGAIQVYADATERLREENRLRAISQHDALTGLPNRSLFREQFEQAVAVSAHVPDGGALLILDMNRFKEVNDSLGHQVGDRLLQGVVIRIKRCLRKTDILARLGGDEFGIIVTDVNGRADAFGLGERINAVMEHPFRLSGHLIYSTVSIGVVLFGTGAEPDEPANLLRCADIAMYRAKAEGRNTCRMFEERMDTDLRERAALERDLLDALGRDQFLLRYQPQIDLARQEICGAEALLRWHHPERGVVPPDVFIEVAEELGLIVPVGEWVLRTACAQAMTWPGLDIAVNVSPIQLRHAGFSEMVDRVLKETGLPSHRLEIEITEGVLLDDTDRIMSTLRGLVTRGIKIALDDFGTGYSNFSYLRQFPWHKLKIDRSFIMSLEDGAGSAAIVQAVLALGRGLGVRVIAEGVETKRQLELLRQAACDEVQGYLVGMPMDAGAFEAFRAGWRQTRDGLFEKRGRRSRADGPAVRLRQRELAQL